MSRCYARSHTRFRAELKKVTQQLRGLDSEHQVSSTELSASDNVVHDVLDFVTDKGFWQKVELLRISQQSADVDPRVFGVGRTDDDR